MEQNGGGGLSDAMINYISVGFESVMVVECNVVKDSILCREYLLAAVVANVQVDIDKRSICYVEDILRIVCGGEMP
eukprot:4915221-Ditylum_brightwellii.AAC.1